MKRLLLLFVLFIVSQTNVAQKFTKKDSLQGGFRAERTCYDVQRYDLNIKIDITKKFIVGYNAITFKVVDNTNKIQIDLFPNMQVDSIIYNSQKLKTKREYNALFVSFPNGLQKGNTEQLYFYYSGFPIVAKNAPWDGGFVFSADKKGKPWVGVACQGTGASLWWPCKDSQSDEPDKGMSIKVAVPNGLMNVSNGRLKGKEDLKNGFTRWDWEVVNPINTYGVTINIADYAHIQDNFEGLSLDYYVLKENEERARKHFEEVKPMLKCFQSKFGKYPFWEDGYKLVESSYLGMEHQSAVAYGNKYNVGYLGQDLSSTGVGLLFDYIIIHESGHEWFGNAITSRDIADMWIHEGFTQYLESVYVECRWNYDRAKLYLNGLKNNVKNDKPIIGNYGVNNEGSGDMYPKGALMLHTLRSVVNDDILWWKMLAKFSETYKHKIIDTETVVNFFNAETGRNLTPVFNQYLRSKNVPILEFNRKSEFLEYRWKTDVANFNMPIDIKLDGKDIRIEPSTTWTKTQTKNTMTTKVDVPIDRFYVIVK